MPTFLLVLGFTIALVAIVALLVRRDRRQRDLDRRVLLRAIAQITLDRERQQARNAISVHVQLDRDSA